MKIEKHLVLKMTISKFAKVHGLAMVVTERTDPSLPKFYASFKGAEVREREYVLVGEFGNGKTPKEAIKNYSRRISGKVLNVGGFSGTDIHVPILVEKKRRKG